MSKRFEVKEHHNLPLMFDNKTGEFYTKLLAHQSVLKEFCRIANNLDRKVNCCTKRLDLMSQFVDKDALNKYLEENNLEGCDEKTR